MILHYANLCVVAGGVDLFLLGSELRGVETIRGPAWTQAGTVSGGVVTWDYPFVAGLIQLSDDVRSVFDAAALTKDTVNLHNLIAYSADWSDWMGFQHPGENGQWPHLDQLYAHANIDLVSFDNYLPLSDWTTGDAGLDAQNWLAPAPRGTWPPTAATFNGLGLTSQPTIYSIPYLQGNIEGGQYFNWFYNDGNNGGIGLDPNGTDLRVSLPQGDRLTQTRNPYYSGQEILGEQTTAMVVEQLSPGGICQCGGVWVAARRKHGVGAAGEVDHFCRIWLPGVRPRHQSAERVLRPGVDRERDALLVDLGSERERRRRLRAAARRRIAAARAAGDL